MPKWKHILLLFAVCQVSLITYSQGVLNHYIKLPPQELSVEQYLDYIHKTTGFSLAFNYDLVENRRLALLADSMRLRVLLDTLFTEHKVKYFFRDNTLILAPVMNDVAKRDHILVKGAIVNERNDKAIPFATVYVPGASIGTISNYEGNFELFLPVRDSIDSLEVSCIGYKPAIIKSRDFLTGKVQVRLRPSNFQIDELIVRPEDPKTLIRESLEKKDENYSTKPAMLTAFFRESSKQNDHYIALSEAVIDIYKTSYANDDPDLVKLKKGRHGTNIEQPELVNLVVEGGLYNSMQLDIVKYGVSFIDPDYFNAYDYTLTRHIFYQGRLTYVISFRFNGNAPITGFDGKLYMDVETLAIVRADFEISDKGLDKARSILVRKSPPSFVVKPKHAQYEVEYRYYDSTWNLMQARSDIAFKLRKKRGHQNKGFSCIFSSTSEFVITGRNTVKFEKIKYRDASKPHDILYDQITSTDPGYWGTENIILPEEPLLKTIEKLKLMSKSKDSSNVIISQDKDSVNK